MHRDDVRGRSPFVMNAGLDKGGRFKTEAIDNENY